MLTRGTRQLKLFGVTVLPSPVALEGSGRVTDWDAWLLATLRSLELPLGA